MHETSLVAALLRQVARLAREHRAAAVEEIRVEMGPLSGVERPLIELAFAELADGTVCRGARLRVEEVPLEAVCCDCGARFEIQRFRFRCRRCDSPRLEVLRGDAFRLVDVVLRTHDVADSGCGAVPRAEERSGWSVGGRRSGCDDGIVRRGRSERDAERRS
ncbi:MAG: hydrogenase maturation nickel metallochaperone HypA [Planctomycetota bacterium]|nr:MAG: hydrogenase maturation nickel metallochaperone HypA [Planctomycetota bacterium]